MSKPGNIDRDPIYENGILAILDRAERRRVRLSFASGESLPHADADLSPFVTRIAQAPDESEPISGNDRKLRAMRDELQGLPDICALHGLLIAHLRKRSFPTEAPVLFQRIWAEHGALMLQHLDLRWQVSAVTTFGDHGTTQAQRSVGLGLTMLFGMMKLYETERLYSGTPSQTPFALSGRTETDLPMEMDGFSIGRGDLDYNLIARLWREAVDDPVIRPLAHNLLTALVNEPRGVFFRVSKMRGTLATRAARRARDAERGK